MTVPVLLTFRWIRVISIRVLFSNSTIKTMNHQFGFLVACDTSSNFDSCSLGRSYCGCFGIASALNLPITIRSMRNMLVLSHV